MDARMRASWMPVSHRSSASAVIGPEPAAELPEVGDRHAERSLDVDADARHPGQARGIGERAELGHHSPRRGHRSTGTSSTRRCYDGVWEHRTMSSDDVARSRSVVAFVVADAVALMVFVVAGIRSTPRGRRARPVPPQRRPAGVGMVRRLVRRGDLPAAGDPHAAVDVDRRRSGGPGRPLDLGGFAERGPVAGVRGHRVGVHACCSCSPAAGSVAARSSGGDGRRMRSRRRPERDSIGPWATNRSIRTRTKPPTRSC